MNKSIDEYIKFKLADCGWYLGEAKIEFFEESLEEIGVDSSIVSFQNIDSHGATDGERIFLKESLKRYASLVQIQFIVLHEYYHIHLGHCVKELSRSKRANHKQEYACDRLALKHLIKCGSFNKKEIMDAISVFKDIIVGDESDTHPSSIARYKRLMEYV